MMMDEHLHAFIDWFNENYSPYIQNSVIGKFNQNKL